MNVKVAEAARKFYQRKSRSTGRKRTISTEGRERERESLSDVFLHVPGEYYTSNTTDIYLGA
jgi:hypothetical protein